MTRKKWEWGAIHLLLKLVRIMWYVECRFCKTVVCSIFNNRFTLLQICREVCKLKKY